MANLLNWLDHIWMMRGSNSYFGKLRSFCDDALFSVLGTRGIPAPTAVRDFCRVPLAASGGQGLARHGLLPG